MSFERGFRQSFGERISNIIEGGDTMEVELTVMNMFVNELVFDGSMLQFGVEDGVTRDGDRTVVVT